MTNSESINRFLEEISARSKYELSSTENEHIAAMTILRSALSELAGEDIQLIDGANIVSSYKALLTKTEYKPQCLDFILRKHNLELQIEVKLKTGKRKSIKIADIKRYKDILRKNTTTDEILVVWVENQFPTLVMDYGRVLHYLDSNEETIHIDIGDLKPLADAIADIIERHRHTWIRQVELDKERVGAKDSEAIFHNELVKNIGSLADSESRRRYAETKEAVKYISKVNINKLEQLFKEIKRGNLAQDEIENKLITFVRNI